MTNKYFENYTIRLYRLNAVIMMFALIIFGKFCYFQIIDHPDIKQVVIKDGYRHKTIIGDRGKILDANQKELAVSSYKYNFWVNTNKDFNKEEIEELFTKVFNRKENYYSDNFRKKTNYLVLEKNIESNIAFEILKHIRNIKGLHYDKIPQRYYSYNNFACQIIGYTNNDRQGMLGIENKFNHLLNGDTTTIELIKSAKGKYINPNILNNPKINGYDIQLTIDIDLQRIIQEELSKITEKTSAKGANGIIMNPYTGEILAMASVPDFDPNSYYEYPIENFKNSVISDTYEPGSTFKIIPIILSLELDLYNNTDSIYCENGKYMLQNKKYLHDHEEHKFLNIEEILIHSSNIGISKISEKYSNLQLYKLIKKFGFNTKTYIPLNNESPGKIRNISNWSKTSKNYISIGQEISINNLQLGLAYSAIANGGYLTEPAIIKRIFKNQEIKYIHNPKYIRRVMTKEISNQLIEMLNDVVELGTAKEINLNGYNIAGKTGTAQKYIDGNYSKYISTFASIIPSNNPKYIMIVSVDEPKYGYHWATQSAVPASREIIKRLLIQDEKLHERVSDEIYVKNQSNNNSALLSKNRIDIKNSFPDFRGKTLNECLKIAKIHGITLEPNGISGKVVYQSIKPGTKIFKEIKCKIKVRI